MIGAVLAGGRGARLSGGEGKATVQLAGRPLVEHAIAALRAVVPEVVVVAKVDTPMPERITAPFWPDDEDDHHPRHGIVSALRYAEPEPVLVLAVDLPLVTVPVLAALRETGAVAAGQPLLGVYPSAALARLEAAPADEPLRRTVERLGLPTLDVPAGTLLNVNTPADLAEAERRSAGA